jgi:phenylacetate-CoA ligase
MGALADLLRHGVRRNVLARARARALGARERAPPPRLLERQAALLRATLAAARARLPAYARLPPPPPGADPASWLRAHAPIVDKAALLARRLDLYPNGGVARPWWPRGRTSGTTGTPLEVFRSVDSAIWEEAFQLQAWSWTGYRGGQRQAVLRGDAVAPLAQAAPPFWHWDRAGRQLFVSTRHLSERNAASMLDALAAAAPTLLRAYPSACMELARLSERLQHGWRVPVVVTGSEPLYPVQRALIESALGCKVFDFYGMAERIAYAAQCERGFYHLHPEYAFVEIVDADGRPTDGFGSIVGTTLHNQVMPLLRYRISDQARWLAGACPCGRSYPRIELAAGKLEDQLYDADGNAVSASIITFAFKGLDNIRKAQVAQVGQGAWEVRLVPDSGYRDADGAALLRNIADHVSGRVAVRLRLVDELALQASGKFKWVVQEWLHSHR